jgi:dTDP-4-dehydrorhamnose reductase
MTRYAVIGAAGQLGRDLCPRLAGEVVPLARDRADLTQPDLLAQTLGEIRPEVVINCAAYNFVDRAESEPPAVFAVNTWGVRDLARVCAGLGCVLVQFSTDHVFGLDAARRTPWTEADAPGPVNLYGVSKLAGEYLVRALCPRHLVIRTCGLYGSWGSGGKGGNFVETMLKLAARGGPVRVVEDQVCTPSYTVDVAETAVALLAAQRWGLYHVTSSGACSWYEFARGVFEQAGLTVDLRPISSQEFGAPARRPAYSTLANEGLARLGLGPLPPWQQALGRYLRERQQKAGV